MGLGVNHDMFSITPNTEFECLLWEHGNGTTCIVEGYFWGVGTIAAPVNDKRCNMVNCIFRFGGKSTII